jgi:cobalamin 5'-phosphate synthase/cobalamin synthase
VARTALTALRAAVAFLTRVPVDRGGDVTAADVGRGAVWFPAVGAAVGGAAAITAWAVALALPPAVAALAAVAVGALLTGALHLDGLADTADGYGAATRERALEIMRDHAVGAFGVLAITLDVGLRTAAVAALLARPHGLLALVAAGALSRSASACLGLLLPDARAAAGAGGRASLLAGGGPRRALVAAGLGAAVAVPCLGGWHGPAVVAAAAGAAALWGWHCRRRLGGVTGDTLGAASEGVEALVLLLAVAWR